MSCITLLSDLGLHDAGVAVAKGILMQSGSGLPVVDISHEVSPFHTGQAAYLLSGAWRNFPAGSVHILLFDLYSSNTTQLLLCEREGHYFLSADNGVLPLAFHDEQLSGWLCLELKKGETTASWLHAAGDIIKQLQASPASALGLQNYRFRHIHDNDAIADTLPCEVVHIDRYENVVLDLTRERFNKAGNGRSFSLKFMRVEEIEELSNTYADVRPGFKLCRFNSAGHMEICINRGKAASLFGLRLGARNNEIKLAFE